MSNFIHCVYITLFIVRFNSSYFIGACNPPSCDLNEGLRSIHIQQSSQLCCCCWFYYNTKLIIYPLSIDKYTFPIHCKLFCCYLYKTNILWTRSCIHFIIGSSMKLEVLKGLWIIRKIQRWKIVWKCSKEYIDRYQLFFINNSFLSPVAACLISLNPLNL